jgi:hypothetical protein
MSGDRLADAEWDARPPGSRCWLCERPAVGVARLAGWRRKRRALCEAHRDAIFGAADPFWRKVDAKTRPEIAREWLAAMTVLAQSGRPLEQALAEIAAVTDAATATVRVTTPLPPGEKRDLEESARAFNQLRSRETLIHAMLTQVLLRWCAEATGETSEQVLQRLALQVERVIAAI